MFPLPMFPKQKFPAPMLPTDDSALRPGMFYGSSCHGANPAAAAEAPP